MIPNEKWRLSLSRLLIGSIFPRNDLHNDHEHCDNSKSSLENPLQYPLLRRNDINHRFCKLMCPINTDRLRKFKVYWKSRADARNVNTISIIQCLSISMRKNHQVYYVSLYLKRYRNREAQLYITARQTKRLEI